MGDVRIVADACVPVRRLGLWEGGGVKRYPLQAPGGEVKPPSTTVGPLVELDHGEAWTTSRLVAEKFGKKHGDVIRAIKKKRCSPEVARRNFALSEYVDPTGRTVPMYRLSRDGFSLVAMGFTGEAAVAWQERFIAAFNKMERELRRIAENKALPDWKEARQLGKAERRELTDVVQEHALNAQARGDSTTPVERWIMAATKTVSAALFVGWLQGESSPHLLQPLDAPGFEA